MRTARVCGESGIYHVVSRGVGQQIIFETDADRRRYLESLQNLMPESSGTLLAWCLMDNHVHLLVRQPLDELSALMRRLNSGYALYFNLVHGRSGHLFQGRFRSEPVDTEEYLMTVVRYIHQNPWKAEMTSDCQYEWSSYGLYASGNVPAGAEIVMDVFGSADAFRAFHGNSDFDATCIDVTQRRMHADDDCALETALELFGDSGLGEVKSLPRKERDAALVKLKARGLSIRQVQRLTGVSIGVISRAVSGR